LSSVLVSHLPSLFLSFFLVYFLWTFQNFFVQNDCLFNTII
jgi:hypothetical protein